MQNKWAAVILSKTSNLFELLNGPSCEERVHAYSLTHEALNPKTENIAIFTQKSIYLEKMVGKNGAKSPYFEGGKKEN